MSGIIIDVDTRSAKSESSLNSLNNSLSDIIKNADKTNKSLNSLSGNSLSDLSRKTRSASDSAKAFGTEGTASFRRVSNEAANTASVIDSIKSAVTGLAASFAAFTAVNGFNKAADQLTNLNNRLQLVAKSSEEVFQLQRRISEVARDTRGNVQNTASTYVSLSDALKKSNVAHAEHFEILGTLNKAAALSGSSVEGLNGAFLQLTQGLSSGTLRGEELNSVLEQFPYLGKAMRETLNQTTGELRAFAEQGRLTDKVMVDVFKNMAGKTAADFAKTSITVEQASSQIRQSTSLMFGDLNKHFGFADRFARNLSTVSGAMQGFGDEIVINSIDIKRSITNAINQFDLFDAVQLTVRTMVNLDISPLDAYSKYKEYKKIKQYMDGFRGLFSQKLDVKAEAPEVKIGEIDADFSKVDSGARTLKETLFDLGSVAFGVFEAVRITFENLISLFPRFQIPVMGLVTSLMTSFKSLAASASAATYDSMMPFARSIEGIYENLTLFMFDDTALERRWVDLFKSDSLKEFANNLRALNDERQSGKLDDLAHNFQEIERSVKETLTPVRNMLVSLGILDNQLLKLRDSKVDRIAKYFSNIKDVVVRVYKDVFATTVEPIAKKVMYNISAIYETVADAFHDTFTISNGEALGTNMVKGFAQAFSILRSAMKSVFDVSLLEGLFSESLFDKFIGKVSDVFSQLGKFFKGFVVGMATTIRSTFSGGSIFSAIDDFGDKIDRKFLALFSHTAETANDLLNSINLHKIRYAFDFDTSSLDKAAHYVILMFEQMVRLSWKPLAALELMIKKFCGRVKDYFFDVYDAVVGHSYWPDMIDGVVNYTDNLFKSESTVKRFTKGIKNVFADLYQSMLELGDRTGGVFGEFTDALAGTDWSAASSKLATNLSATLLSTLFLLFGDTRLKVSAAIFVASTLNSALGNALTVFVPALAGTLGEAMSHYFQNVVKGVLSIIEVSLAAIPQAIQSFIGSLGLIGSAFAKLMSIVPVFHNRLLWGMIAVAALYAKFAKGGSGTIVDIIFGKEATKKKPQVDGVVDYIKSYFQSLSGITGTVGVSFIEGMFRSKKLAIAAAVAFSSAMLDSINLFEASTVGLPLLFYAIMGRDGGSRLLVETTSTAVKIIKGMLGSLRNQIERTTGSDSLFLKLFDLPGNAISRMRNGSGKDSPLKQAASAFLHDFKSTIVNLNQNADAYAQRKMTLSEALLSSANASLVGPIKPGTKVGIQKSFNELITTMTTKNVGGIQMPNMLGTMVDGVTDGLQKVKKKLKGVNIVDTLTEFATGIYNGVGKALKVSFSLIAEGLSVLFALIKNKYVLVTALTLGLASMSFAASDATTAVTGTATAIGKLGLAIAGIVGGLAVLGGLSKTFKLFQSTKLDYHKKHGSDELKKLLAESEETFAAAQAYNKAVEIRRRGVTLDPGAIYKERTKYTRKYTNLKDAGASEGTLKAAAAANDAAMSAFSIRNYSKQRRNISKLQKAEIDGYVRGQVAIRRARIKELMKESAPAARGAAVDAAMGQLSELKDKAVTAPIAVGGAIVEAVGGIGRSFKNAKQILTGSKASVLDMSEGFHRMRKAVNNVGAALNNVFAASGFGRFTASIGLLGSVLVNTFTGSIGAIQMLYEVGIKHMLGGTARSLKNFGSTLVNLFSNIAGGLISALGLLRPLLAFGGKIALVVGAVGALGLFFFGPGNTFFDNLEWAYDKIRAIVGLEAKTGGGRSVELAGLVKPTTVDNRETNFSKDLARVDTAKMTAAQYKAVKSVAEETGKALQDLQLSEAKQGYFTAAQKNERKKIEDDFRNTLARQPQKEGKSGSADMVDFSRRMLDVDNGVWSVLKRTLGWSAIREQEQTPSSYNTLTAYLPDVVNKMFEPLTKAAGEAADAVGKMGEEAYKASLEFGKSQVKRIAEFWAEAWDQLKDRPTAFQTFESKESLRIAGMTQPFKQYLPDNVNKVIEDARSEYENAALRVRDLERGHTGVDGKTFAEWAKDNNAAIKGLAAKKEFYERISKTYGAFGKEEETLSLFSTDMEKFAKEVKTSLGIDLGPKAIDFKGSIVDQAVLRADVAAVEKINKALERTLTLQRRVALNKQKEDIKARSKQYVDNLNAQDTFEGRLAFQTKQFGTGINPDMVRRLSMNSELSFRQSFQELAVAIQSKEADRDQLPAESPLRAKIELELSNLNKRKQDLFPVTEWIDDINTRLQALNIPQLTSTQYLATDKKGIDSLRTALTQAGTAAENVRRILASGDMLDPKTLNNLKTAMSDMVRTDATVRRIQERAVLNEKLAVLKDDSLNDAAKLQKLQGLGVGLTPENLRDASNYSRLLKQIEISLTAKSTQLPEDGSLIDSKTFAKSQQAMINAERAAGRIGEVVNLDSLLGQFQSLGVALDGSTFATYGAAAKRELLALGKELLNIERQVSEVDGAVIAGGMEKIEAARNNKLERAQKIMSAESLKSAASIESVLSNAGFSSFELIANLTADQLREFVELANKVATEKLRFKGVKTPEAYINAQAALAKANKQFNTFGESKTAGFESKTGNINNLFKTNLDNVDFAQFGSRLINQLNDVAVAFKNKLEEAMKTGVNLEPLLLQTRKFAEMGEYVTFFSEVHKSMYDAMTRGAKSAFEKFKSLYAESPLEFDDFTRIDVATRRKLSAQAAETDAFGKALELSNLSKELTDILNNVGGGVSISETMRMFSEELGKTTDKTFEEMTGTPFERLIGAVNRLSDTIDNKLPGKGNGKAPSPSPAPAPAGGIAPGTYEAYNNQKRREQRAALDAALKDATPTGRLQLMDKEAHSTNADKMLRLNTQQRNSANKMLEGILEQQAQINEASAKGLPTDGMYRKLDEMTRLYDAYIDRIGTIRQRFVEAGRNFADSVVGGFNSALGNFLKNKQEENKTRWTTFRDSFLTHITDNVIDTLVSGFTDSFTGEGSALRAGLQGLGGGISSLFKGGEESGASSVSVENSSGEKGIIDSIAEFFAPVTSVLGAIFGATSSGATTTVGAISASTTSIVTAINAGTYAITTALIGSSASDGIEIGLKVLSLGAQAGGAAGGGGGGGGSPQVYEVATGGLIRGPGTGTSDSIPAMLSNGEYVINAAQTAKFKPLLEAINNGNMSFASGGLVTPSPYVTPTMSNTVSQSSTQQININITGDISRQTKSEIHKLIPVIATGVNAHNREVLMS